MNTVLDKITITQEWMVILNIKKLARHYYLREAICNLRKNKYEETEKNLKIVERIQKEIEDIEHSIESKLNERIN